MSDFEATRQAVLNLIAEHEDIDVLLQEVSIILKYALLWIWEWLHIIFSVMLKVQCENGN